MKFIGTFNHYDIYEYSKKECIEYNLCYPCYGAFTPYADRTPIDEECSMNDIEALIEWCEKN